MGYMPLHIYIYIYVICKAKVKSRGSPIFFQPIKISLLGCLFRRENSRNSYKYITSHILRSTRSPTIDDSSRYPIPDDRRPGAVPDPDDRRPGAVADPRRQTTRRSTRSPTTDDPAQYPIPDDRRPGAVPDPRRQTTRRSTRSPTTDDPAQYPIPDDRRPVYCLRKFPEFLVNNSYLYHQTLSIYCHIKIRKCVFRSILNSEEIGCCAVLDFLHPSEYRRIAIKTYHENIDFILPVIRSGRCPRCGWKPIFHLNGGQSVTNHPDAGGNLYST